MRLRRCKGNNVKKICFIAQFPPPIHGLSKAVDTLYNSGLKDEFSFEKVNITDNKKIFSNLIKIFRSHADLFYFTISQTKGGNLRDLLILKLLSLQKKHCLIHLHGGYYRNLVDCDLPGWQRKANYRAVRKLDGAIVLGPSLKWIFEGMLPEEKIHTVPNCVDDEFLMSEDDFLEKLHSINDRKIKHILYLSNFIRSKGYPEVLEIARLEKKQVEEGGQKRFLFDFAGKFFEKEEEDFFWNTVRDYGLEEYIKYHGLVTGDAKRSLLKQCDVFALLTRYPNEGQPISILEAMGNGMLIVTTDHAGIPDLMMDSGNLVIHVDEKSGIDEKLLSAIAETDFDVVEEDNRRIVLRKYCQERYIKNMRSVFAD